MAPVVEGDAPLQPTEQIAWRHTPAPGASLNQPLATVLTGNIAARTRPEPDVRCNSNVRAR